jgi:seryl-tRNA synthetase
MIDPKLLVENPQAVRNNLTRRCDKTDIQELEALYGKRKLSTQKLEELRHNSKLNSEAIGNLMKNQKNAASDPQLMALKNQQQQHKGEIKRLETELQLLEEKIQPTLLRLPNILHESVPQGDSAEKNVEVRRWGKPDESRKSPDHYEIGTTFGLIDFERAGKISGSRFAVLKGMAARLELALIQFMMDTHMREANYVPIIPPYLVTAKTMTGTGQLPKFNEEVFHLEKDGFYLIPTAEVPVTNLHADEIIPEEQLPIRYVAFSPCFRREAGSYGKDIKGLIRQHQFHKVELVKITTPESSFAELESLVLDAEKILQLLGLPYRTMALCSGDIGFSAAKCYDIEVWLAGQKSYREISSCSNCTDFQARRMNLRYKPNNSGKTQLLHTINGSGLAVGRTLIALLEYYWNPDNTITIPPVLRPYMGGVEKIQPQ